MLDIPCLDVGGRALPTRIGAVVGGVGGAIVGVLLRSHSTIYSVSSRSPASSFP
jgi:hypothetical protein